MRWDFLSHHAPFLPSFTFHHISWIESFHVPVCICTNSTTPTPFKRQAKPLMPSTQTSLLLVSSTTLPLCSCS
jgi:hypothetical protein